MRTSLALIIAAIFVIAVLLYRRYRSVASPVPTGLRPGSVLPAFAAIDESGNVVQSGDLRGAAAVMLFVRGNWCPFCSSQIENLSVHYKEIVDLGARLILFTPKPLQTTRRVAEFFKVEFEFWLDEDLAVSKQLGLVQELGVPGDHRKEYGQDTLWPMALVVDPHGVIRFAEKSKQLSDRPNPRTLLKELRAALQG